jgi:hypothetical protein
LDSPNDGSAYAVFGRVFMKLGLLLTKKLVEGEDVLKAIEGVSTTRKSGMADVPITPVVITKARRVSAEEVPAPAPPPKGDL